MRSIRRYLTIWLLIGIGVTVLGSALVIVTIARKELTREFDRGLVGKTQALGALLSIDEEGVEFEFVSGMMPEYERTKRPEYFQVWIEGKGVLARSASLSDSDLQRPPGTMDGPVSWDMDLPDGRRGRAVQIRLLAEPEVDAEPAGASTDASATARSPLAAVIVAARSREALDQALTGLLYWIIGAAAVSCLVIVLLVAFTVHRGLAPLVRLGEQVDDIDAHTLSSRLVAEGEPREVAPLSGKLNELLARLECSFERERRMTSNMAHELRTPIAEIRSAAEVAAKWPDDDTLHRDAVETAREVSEQMSRVVDSLLRLSRTESGHEEVQRSSVDLSRLVNAAWARYEPKARDKGIEVEKTIQPDAAARTDRDLVDLIVCNLVDNAVAHTPDGGRIASTLENGGPEVVWTLINSPVNLDAEDLDRLAEPLWTKESSRSGSQHSGLGLTLARAVAAALGISLEFTLQEGALHAAMHVPAG